MSETEGRGTRPTTSGTPGVDAARQEDTPYADALVAYARRSPGRYNVPGHKAAASINPALAEVFGERALIMDIPPIIDGIDAGEEPSPFELSQQLAAEAWGARRTWFLFNGASAANHAICMALRHFGRDVVVQRNVHTSTIDGLIASGLRPTFAFPEVDARVGIAHCLRPEELDRALREAQTAHAAIVVSPTYYGFSADLAGLREVARSHGVTLVVDEAWGAHFAFSPRLPQDALSAGADLVVSSTHKMLGSLTQSAMLHSGRDGEIDDATIDRAVSLLESTSPSAILAGSLDLARRRAAVEGEALLRATIDAAAVIRQSIEAIPGLATLDDRQIGSFGIAGFDPLRVTIDLSGSGRDARLVNRRLNDKHAVFLELISERALVAILGIGEGVGDAQRLVAGLRESLSVLEPSPSGRSFALPHPGLLRVTPRAAYFSPTTAIDASHAEGRIAAETLAVYPPGVPNVLPGEVITAQNLEHVLRAHAGGLTVRGPADRSLRTIRVIATPHPDAA